MIDINKEISDLIEYAVTYELLDKRDKIYAANRLLDVLELNEYNKPDVAQSYKRELDSILENIRQWADLHNRVENDSVEVLDLFDTKLMAELIKMPSDIEREFYNHYKNSPVRATEYYYAFAKNTNYIRVKRIEKDIKWTHETSYGTLDMTINLSKPEKDPRAIAKAKEIKSSSYPKCLLCKENEGYSGTLNHPARGNHRVIGINLSEEMWYLQYSPYIYYNEHCIVFNEEHNPMKITKRTFKNLLEFVQMFPHYFIGSNADLPIVGGSILSHDHFQGGNYSFAMANAKEENVVFLNDDIVGCTLNWPMSVIRIKGKNTDKLIDAAYEIFLRWKDYSDEQCLILSHTSKEEHNTITPICRFRGELYELDLVLRNNRTTAHCPYGIFHPREEYHHIKKENIGLIEVMGLAVLPARLKKEMELLKPYLINNDMEGIKSCDDLIKHFSWAEMIMAKYQLSNENITDILNKEIAEIFLCVLKDAGVFKDTESGKDAFKKCRDALFINLK